jgi:beta-ribofuranosylaminobenzene 5'-phosphate synthase
MLKEGVYGAGQSSWGPTVYGIVKDTEALRVCEKVQEFLKDAVGEVFVAKANNQGATIRTIK